MGCSWIRVWWAVEVRKWTNLVLEFTLGIILRLKLWGRVTESVLVLRESVCKWAMRAITPWSKVVLVEHITICLVETNISWEVWKCSNGFILQRGKAVENSWFTREIEMATSCFYLMPLVVGGH